MTLALDPSYPVWDILLTMLVGFGLALFGYLLFVVFRDLFGRDDLSGWLKTGWTVLVLVVPIAGSLAYLVSQSGAMGERRLRRAGATQLRLDSFARTATGDGAYRGLRDTTRDRQAMAGPIRPA